MDSLFPARSRGQRPNERADRPVFLSFRRRNKRRPNTPAAGMSLNLCALCVRGREVLLDASFFSMLTTAPQLPSTLWCDDDDGCSVPSSALDDEMADHKGHTTRGGRALHWLKRKFTELHDTR